MSLSHGTDCFPSLVVEDSGKWIRYDFTFERLRDAFKSQSKAFISWIPELFNPQQKLYYQSIQKSKFIEQHEAWCMRSAERTREMQPLSWDKMDHKLRNPIRLDTKNSDQRMCFRYQSAFLTKCYFTFGHRTVREKTYHLFQTSKNPILFYKQRPSASPTQRVQRSFDLGNHHTYEKFVMVPDTLYCVPPGTDYLIVTCQKSLFAVDVVSKQAWKKLKKYHSFSKVTEKKYSPLRSEPASTELDFLPPATPAMDRVHDLYSNDAAEEEETFEVPFSIPSRSKKPKKSKSEEPAFKIPFLPPPFEREPEEVSMDTSDVYYVYESLPSELPQTVRDESLPSELPQTVRDESLPSELPSNESLPSELPSNESLPSELPSSESLPSESLQKFQNEFISSLRREFPDSFESEQTPGEFPQNVTSEPTPSEFPFHVQSEYPSHFQSELASLPGKYPFHIQSELTPSEYPFHVQSEPTQSEFPLHFQSEYPQTYLEPASSDFPQTCLEPASGGYPQTYLEPASGGYPQTSLEPASGEFPRTFDSDDFYMDIDSFPVPACLPSDEELWAALEELMKHPNPMPVPDTEDPFFAKPLDLPTDLMENIFN